MTGGEESFFLLDRGKGKKNSPLFFFSFSLSPLSLSLARKRRQNLFFNNRRQQGLYAHAVQLRFAEPAPGAGVQRQCRGVQVARVRRGARGVAVGRVQGMKFDFCFFTSSFFSSSSFSPLTSSFLFLSLFNDNNRPGSRARPTPCASTSGSSRRPFARVWRTISSSPGTTSTEWCVLSSFLGPEAARGERQGKKLKFGKNSKTKKKNKTPKQNRTTPPSSPPTAPPAPTSPLQPCPARRRTPRRSAL